MLGQTFNFQLYTFKLDIFESVSTNMFLIFFSQLSAAIFIFMFGALERKSKRGSAVLSLSSLLYRCWQALCVVFSFFKVQDFNPFSTALNRLSTFVNVSLSSAFVSSAVTFPSLSSLHSPRCSVVSTSSLHSLQYSVFRLLLLVLIMFSFTLIRMCHRIMSVTISVSSHVKHAT